MSSWWGKYDTRYLRECRDGDHKKKANSNIV